MRSQVRNLGVLTAIFGALLTAPSLATAQGWSEWDRWSAPRRAPPWRAQPSEQQYDDSQSDWRDEPRRYRRYDDGRSGTSSQRYERDNYDSRQRDTARDEDGQPGKPEGVSGGLQPAIQPVAPATVAFTAQYAVGSIVIDTGARKLYYVTGPMSAYAYPIGVGREGFSWTGSEKVSRVSDWPEWYPPAEMRQRKPELPERMLGGLNNPLGAKAIYLGNTLYRIHGTNDPKSIGKAESSGCFRMLNANVLHLASLVQVGTPVSVVRSLNRGAVAVSQTQTRPRPVVEPRRTTERVVEPRPAYQRYEPQWRVQQVPRPRWRDEDEIYPGDLR